MDAFPAYIPLAGRVVAIVGDGEQAEAKARLLESSPARILRLSGREALDPAAYAGVRLAFIAGGKREYLKVAAEAARSAGALVNVTDHPDLSDFMTPAVVDRGPVVAAVGTAGAAPMLAALLRNDLEARIPAGAGRAAALFGQMRETLRKALPDLDDRRAFMREALKGPAAEAAMAGDMKEAKRLLALAIEAWTGGRPAAAGHVRLIQADGPGDLISLRAARALAEADALLVDEGVTAELPAMARREARRIDRGEAALATMIGLAREGRRILWLVAGTPDADLIEALSAAGVALER
jgi:precorrin-2 dehydrogenase/sirohydrochlorin ferrochelatase